MTYSLSQWRLPYLSRLSRRNPYNVVLLTGLCGYPVVAGITTPLGLSNTAVSAGLRSVTAGAAVVSIVLNAFSRRLPENNYLIIALYVFWILYLFRIIEATLLSNVELWHSVYFYFAWAVAGSALPMFALALVPTVARDLDNIFPWIYLLLFAAGALVLFGGSTYAGRLHLASLDPISTGHVGASICVLSMWALLFGPVHDNAPRAAFVGGLILGFYILVASNSRGPILAFFAVLPMFLVVSGRRRIVISVMAAGAALLAFIPVALLLETQFNISTFSRLFDQNFFQEVSVALRWKLYVGAIDVFLQSPLFGAALEVPGYKAYPHNIFIEAFMATGVVGGALLLAVVFLVCVKGLRFAYRNAQQGWIFVLFVQYLIGAQFSGSLYSVTYFWILLGVMLSIEELRAAEMMSVPPRRATGATHR